MLKKGDIVLLKEEQNKLGIVTVGNENNLVIYPTDPTQFSLILQRAAKVKGYNIKDTIENLLFVDPIELAIESSIHEPDYDKIIRLDNMVLKDLRFPIGATLDKENVVFEVEKYIKDTMYIVAPWTDQRVITPIEGLLKIFPDDITVIAIKEIINEVFGYNDGIKYNKMIKSAAIFNGEKKEVPKNKTNRVLRGAALRAVINKK